MYLQPTLLALLGTALVSSSLVAAAPAAAANAPVDGWRWDTVPATAPTDGWRWVQVPADKPEDGWRWIQVPALSKRAGPTDGWWFDTVPADKPADGWRWVQVPADKPEDGWRWKQEPIVNKLDAPVGWRCPPGCQIDGPTKREVTLDARKAPVSDCPWDDITASAKSGSCLGGKLRLCWPDANDIPRWVSLGESDKCKTSGNYCFTAEGQQCK
ncbi:uncharacterized protein EV422DRAFT_190464 [Fimicolochytrium jonesii]|uniref:uncharacterized protein n=1 Tax=Fimicolochytrium jonesii TaxID=1396493 RepID=UPI0022FF0D42|nr:uncharacterized protein EV422DRAFT_190464 [Fimicolochytrium jonesii]KAI8818124.1 hypothetical protein EV422DRAFT_190464 [Fimicolochytrium jonesii]